MRRYKHPVHSSPLPVSTFSTSSCLSTPSTPGSVSVWAQSVTGAVMPALVLSGQTVCSAWMGMYYRTECACRAAHLDSTVMESAVSVNLSSSAVSTSLFYQHIAILQRKHCALVLISVCVHVFFFRLWWPLCTVCRSRKVPTVSASVCHSTGSLCAWMWQKPLHGLLYQCLQMWEVFLNIRKIQQKRTNFSNQE